MTMDITRSGADEIKYANATFSAGLASGAGVDTLYLEIDKPDQGEPIIFYVRPDEMMAIIKVCSTALWAEDRIKSR